MPLRHSFTDRIEIETVYLRAWELLCRLIIRQVKHNPPKTKSALNNLRGMMKKITEQKRRGIAARAADHKRRIESNLKAWKEQGRTVTKTRKGYRVGPPAR